MRDEIGLLGVGAVREVEAGDVEAGANELAEDVGSAAGGTEGGDDLGAASGFHGGEGDNDCLDGCWMFKGKSSWVVCGNFLTIAAFRMV